MLLWGLCPKGCRPLGPWPFVEGSGFGGLLAAGLMDRIGMGLTSGLLGSFGLVPGVAELMQQGG